MKKKLLEQLLELISDNKKELFDKIIAQRTKHVTVVLENIFQPQNASAVMRSCDVFGIQDLHVIENDNAYNINPRVVMGSSKWVNLHQYNEKENNTLDCINKLKSQGYKIYATTPHTDDCLIEDIDLSQKCALLFGTELEGLSQVAMDNADGFVKIPMYGFTESLNISVCAAISLYEISRKLKSSDIDWQLTEEERIEQLLIWSRKVIRRSDIIEQDFIEKLLLEE